jgi:hypothetical protein
MKACVNMSKGINSLELIKKYIIPAIPNISSLAKVTILSINLDEW